MFCFRTWCRKADPHCNPVEEGEPNPEDTPNWQKLGTCCTFYHLGLDKLHSGLRFRLKESHSLIFNLGYIELWVHTWCWRRRRRRCRWWPHSRAGSGYRGEMPDCAYWSNLAPIWRIVMFCLLPSADSFGRKISFLSMDHMWCSYFPREYVKILI